MNFVKPVFAFNLVARGLPPGEFRPALVKQSAHHMREEGTEAWDAFQAIVAETDGLPYPRLETLEKLPDAFIDSIYVAVQGLWSMGYTEEHIKQMFMIVHRANVRKRWRDGTYHLNENQKIMKPPEWKPPSLGPYVQQLQRRGLWLPPEPRPSDER